MSTKVPLALASNGQPKENEDGPGWRIDANTIDFDNLKAGMKNDTYEQCPECKTYMIWKKIPEENILQGTELEEFWGAPCSYQTVTGYICPACNTKIDF